MIPSPSGDTETVFRRTEQELLPLRHSATAPGIYDLYPGYEIGPAKIEVGFAALAEKMLGKGCVILDGHSGVLWEHTRTQLSEIFDSQGLRVAWHATFDQLLPEPEIDALIEPFLAGGDPLFGRRCTLRLEDFFRSKGLASFVQDLKADLNIVYGPGASLTGWKGLMMYLDVPKNETQYRSRAGSITNLGAKRPDTPKNMYKRYYFVDWVVLDQHKASVMQSVDFLVDTQRPYAPTLIHAEELRQSLSEISQNYFRVRPWFYSTPWGGNWMLKKIPGLSTEVPNLAVSFELIVPENGLLLLSDSLLLEVSFDLLMFQEYQAVMGSFADRFGLEFPIRFDFLDTFGGGNLSIQVHPLPDYIREHFGETFTQDETYYILDCKPDARVYLGFQDDVDPQAFRQAVERSFQTGEKMEVDRFVQSVPSHKHDLFLIPGGTIHGSGINNLVLEISATTYIFTFRMYDWQRMDLDGRPRRLNVDRAFDNLCFDRKGEWVTSNLVSKPALVQEGPDWRLLHLPTHQEHFYQVHRYEFEHRVRANTEGSPHVLSLVEGDSIWLETAAGKRQRFNYAETFVVPAASESYQLVNEGGGEVKVVQASLKPEWFEEPSHDWLQPRDRL
jgi:mannose-6-phosphate isomerase class I